MLNGVMMRSAGVPSTRTPKSCTSAENSWYAVTDSNCMPFHAGVPSTLTAMAGASGRKLATRICAGDALKLLIVLILQPASASGSAMTAPRSRRRKRIETPANKRV